MAEDSAMREGSLPVSWGVRLVPFSPQIGCLSLTLLFSDPARSTRFILPVNAEMEFRRCEAREINERTDIGDWVYYAGFYSQNGMGS